MRRHVPGGTAAATAADAGFPGGAAAQGQAVPGVLELEWFDLRKKVLQQLIQGMCTVDAADKELRSWDDTVLRFRKLREALTAAHAPAGMRCEVYELSAVVCAAARNMAELLKCLQQLVNSIYPAVQAAAQPAVVMQAAVQPAAAATAAVQAVDKQQQQTQGLPPASKSEASLTSSRK
ncbi:hypothetical protein COO60DRAFT_1127324 [Scenedesmus sp. NREL 46B-D3]|nr:hypothetical protein COO60DRAFT_1127324 [Scenedesmus sp. NREL 46B-D3]